ncbi:MAG: TIGR00269 family protein [Candidatus Aenigmarchaeota archaeon]|nr:TIGR00269 family protein [Candidatus Aenigmarchaeota archaeon]
MKCRCGSKAVYERKTEGSFYCDDCLARQVEKRFQKTISENKLVKAGDTIAVALSGGKDSSALLYMLNNSKNPKTEIFAISIDEGIRGRGICLEKASCLTKKLGIRHFIFSFEEELGITIDSIKDRKTCTYCGVFKRNLINKKARELGANKIAVGHNLNDEAQSILLNFLRGDCNHFQRLGADPVKDKKFVHRIKPLRDIPEAEIVLYARIKKIPHINRRCIYSYDNQRRDILNMLDSLEKKYPGTIFQIVKFYDRIKPLVSKSDKVSIGYCDRCGEPGGKLCKSCQLLTELKKLS